MPNPNPQELATPADVANFLHVTQAALSQYRYKGIGPKFIKIGGRGVRYRWSEVYAYLDANTMQRTDDPRATA